MCLGGNKSEQELHRQFFLRKACWIHVYTSLQAVLLQHNVFFYIRLQSTRRAPSNVTCTFPQHQTHKHQCIPPHYVKQLLLMPHERLKLSITQHYPPEGSNQCINAFKNALYTDLEDIRNPPKFQSMWKKFNWMIIKWFVQFSSIPNPIMYKCNEINFCNFAFTGFCMTSATPVMMHCEMHRSVSCSMQFSLGHRGRDANIWEAFQLLRIQNGFSCNQQHSIFFQYFSFHERKHFFL